jgi:hypothetical protein
MNGLERAAESERIRVKNEQFKIPNRFARFLTIENKLTTDSILLKELDIEFSKLPSAQRLEVARFLNLNSK